MIKPDWPDIDSVFLDLDGTLLDLHFDNHFWLEYLPVCYAERKEVPLDVAREELYSRYQSVDGTLKWYCLDYWSERLGLDVVSLKHHQSHRIAVHPHVEDFLEKLQRIGKRIVLLTNGHPDGLALKMEKTGLSDYFDRLITSHAIGWAKEEAAFWPALQMYEPFDPGRTLFIDDNLHVLAAAEQFGIANLLAVKRPDSQGQEKDTAHFQAIEDYREMVG